jgi:hypothetical protein
LHFGIDFEQMDKPRRVAIDDIRIELLPSAGVDDALLKESR